MPVTPLRALVVDDDPGTRLLLEEILRKRGFDVDAHETGESALHAFERLRHPLAVLDWRLPGMDGPELCSRMREVPGTEDTYVLFVTGREGGEEIETAMEAGASDYVPKSSLRDQIDVRLSIAERRLREARDRREREEALARDALHDPLTGLANRALLLERLDGVARRATRADARGESHSFAVLLVDLHDFAEVNHLHGKEAADRVLVEAARRLEDSVREVDSVARLQDDDFAVLLDGFRDVSDPSRVAGRIHRSLARPFEGSGVRLGASIGTAIQIGATEDPERLLHEAGRALLRAMSHGPGSHQIFDREMQQRAEMRIRLEGRLSRALEDGEMRLHYQPVVSLEDGRVTGFEALARWQDPERGLVFPGEFVPVAEDTGLVIPLGWWAIGEALGQLRRWREDHPGHEGLTVSVNASPQQLAQSDLVERIVGLLDASGLPPTALAIEVTETSLMGDAERTIEALHRLRETSVRLHVDDFGTGYSSLAYLCRFPLDSLKIDRSFVSVMTRSREEAELVRAILELAHNLGLSVVAEGVETEEQVEALRSLGCDHAQGYHFSRPLPPDEAARLLEAGLG